MTDAIARTPPRFAQWLLQRFGVSDSVVGDLVERYQRRPSTRWYWRQTIMTIAATVAHVISTHKILATRAVVIGCASQWLLLSLLRTPVRNLSGMTGRVMWNWTIEHGFDRLRELWFGGLGGVGGPVFLTVLLVFGTTGWIVGRLHRTQHAALVTLYASFTPLFGAIWLHRESSVAHPTLGFLFIAIPLSALLGGLGRSRVSPQIRG
jgi:hypothetical protein